MIYLDTSFLTPLFRTEAASAQVADFLSRQIEGSLVISKLAGVEFASLISRDVRMRVLTVAQGRRLLAEFDSMAATALRVLIPSGSDFDLAQDYITNFASRLRGPDALHLAVAHNNGVDSVATLDEGMLYAAKQLKIRASRFI